MSGVAPSAARRHADAAASGHDRDGGRIGASQRWNRCSARGWARVLPIISFLGGLLIFVGFSIMFGSRESGSSATSSAPSMMSYFSSGARIAQLNAAGGGSGHDVHGVFSCPSYFPQGSGGRRHSIAVIFGTRPEAIKMASVVRALQDAGASVVTIATGQHRELLSSALSALAIETDVEMALMAPNQELTSLSARLLEHVGCALRQLRPAAVVVQGDTVTATAAALAAFMQGIPVAHVEAGLRTYLPRDPFPEEVQRTAVTAFATLHLAPTQYAADVLLQSGVCASKIAVVGNTVVDAMLAVLGAGPSEPTLALLDGLGLPAPDVPALRAQLQGQGVRPPAAAAAAMPATATWVVVTMHRRENFGAPVAAMVAAVARLAAAFPALRFVVPVHPNPNVHAAITAGLAGVASVRLLEPLPYDQFVFLLAAAGAVLTDSGGLQEEGVALGKRLFVMRRTTERPEALDSGLVSLVGAGEAAIVAQVGAWAAAHAGGPSAAALAGGLWPPKDASPAELAAAAEALEPHPVSAWLQPGLAHTARPASRLLFGDGEAGARIARTLVSFVARFGDGVPGSAANRRAGSVRLGGGRALLAADAAAEGEAAAEAVVEEEGAGEGAAPPLKAAANNAAARKPAAAGSGAEAEADASAPANAAVAARLRAFQSCAHATDAAASLVTSTPLADHILHDFNWHAGLAASSAPAVSPLLAGHQRHRHRTECSAQPATQQLVYRKYQEVLDMPSFFDPASPTAREDFAVTAIVSVFRRPAAFQRWMWSMGNQTFTPKEVWVTTFASAHEAEFRRMIREHDLNHTIFKFISGDTNYKYFGRFALATMAKTPYVALFDDDCIPGVLLINTLLHMINVRNGDYNGMLGMKGHAPPTEDPTNDQHKLGSYWAQWNYRPNDVWRVDLTGGVWFLRTEWLRQMWRERPIPLNAAYGGPWETGEDFHLTYSLKKHLNLLTYLFPTDWGRGETWGASQDYFELSSAGDTTVDNNLELRSNILYGNILRGYTPARTETMWGEAWNRTNVAVLLPSLAHARAIAPVVAYLRTYFHASMRVWPVVALDPTDAATSPVTAYHFVPPAPPPGAANHPGGTVTREQVLAEVGVTFTFAEHRLGVFDLDLGKLSGRMRWRPSDLQIETQSSLQGVFETIRPAAVLIPYDERSPIVTAAAMTASVMGIPALGYTSPALAAYPGGGPAAPAGTPGADECIRVLPPPGLVAAAQPPPTPVFGALPTEPVALCSVPQPVAYSRGMLNFVTNSQTLLVRQLLDTLCACERFSSTGVGTFARCPDLGTDLVLTEFDALPTD